MQSLSAKILLRRIEKKIIFIFQFGHFSIFSFDVGILLSFSISTRHLYNLKTFFRKIYILLVFHFTNINVKGLYVTIFSFHKHQRKGAVRQHIFKLTSIYKCISIWNFFMKLICGIMQ